MWYVAKIQKSPQQHPRLLDCKVLSSPKMLYKFRPIGQLIRHKYLLKQNSVCEGFLAEAAQKCSTPSQSSRGKPTPSKVAANMLDFTSAVWAPVANAVDVALSPSVLPEVVRLTRRHVPAGLMLMTKAGTAPEMEDEKGEEKQSSIVFCECGTRCEDSCTMCKACTQKHCPKEFSGFLYAREDHHHYERYWYKLLNKELYCKVELRNVRD
ncbi:MAG: hypothetical protein P4M11_03090 [Candidatus Pacebacteria bacterium]|nr:hypothetical protein [Candidatus Paceibacterota bacterium]